MNKATIHSAIASSAGNIFLTFCRRIAAPAAMMAWIVLVSNPASATPQQPATPITQEASADLAVKPQPELPAVGKWMVDGKGDFAHWLGELHEGQPLREPINVILVDACGKLHAELPTGKTGAFSNEPFELDNNHGRIFGPCEFGDSFVFVAAFSRENVDPFGTPKHRYGSFNRSRDDFAQRMNKTTAFKLTRFIDLENTGLGMTWTTGDHDGMAAVLYVPKP